MVWGRGNFDQLPVGKTRLVEASVSEGKGQRSRSLTALPASKNRGEVPVSFDWSWRTLCTGWFGLAMLVVKV